ncbi:SGNH/GDSL hydrolase family protein [Cellulophaga sp. HaHaR_3_176]|uniref:SGNH/GDSL hydrolase family protein n=1 Tax=Cellulophaga sp. HaHaR_3_176 TaxID=1942464 RepID=UPI001C200420|nr:SGNH/GDSL hydrolase family protein [Cellulophaga sp. HaHaR_3_176]QWX83220.1 SGNH/GDSL hydrolase family protein [Cellulophaga sp. HaHaR_3_176]
MRLYSTLVLSFLFFSCSSTENIATQNIYETSNSTAAYHYLALGDSYTIGESVSKKNSFPLQLDTSLEDNLDTIVNTEIIATTGWRTDNLLKAIESGSIRDNYDLVTLLIGVNNQFQRTPFDQYKKEFTELIEKSIALTNENIENVIVISIPDYAYTPYAQSGSNREQISKEINLYNDFAQQTALAYNVAFINITDITRQGLENPNLVANDGLHPSAEAYAKFVERIYPIALSILK